MGKKIGGDPRMTLTQFRDLIGDCTDDEIDRVRSRYRSYYLWHRQIFTDLLRGEFESDAEFFGAALNARDQAKPSKESAGDPKESSRARRAALGRTNYRKLVKLATRVLYLRMTGGAGNVVKGKVFKANPFTGDYDPPLKPSDAKKRLVKEMAPWNVGYAAIRNKHTPFQSES